MIKGVKGVIFDMDGTLTMPGAIDFKRMRERLKLPAGVCLLSVMHLEEPERCVGDSWCVGINWD